MIPSLPPLALVSYLGTEKTLLPLVLVALLLDSAIVAVWYMIGSVLRNSTLKSGAISEFYQLAGTVIITVVILSVLGITANLFYNTLNGTRLMSSGTLTTLCNNIMSPGGNSNQLDIIGSKNSFLSGSSSGSGTAAPGICNMLSPTTLGEKIDYPLAASSVIIANMTNQTVTNLNNFFYVDNFIMFLSSFNPGFGVCVGTVTDCVASVGVSFTPYAGIDVMKRNFRNMGTILTMATESFMAQLSLSTMFLYIWPYLLFIGLLLRATFFTRKMGGLFIAIAIGGILFFPMLFSIEYLALGNGIPISQATLSSTYGYNNTNAATLQLPANCQGGTTSKVKCGEYNLNFYVLPSFKDIAMQNQCWTPHYILDEGLDVAGWLALAIGFVLNIINHFLTRAPFGLFTIVCPTTNLEVMIVQMWQAVAITGIITWILPILNLMIVLSGIRGLSGIMGGDTSMAGLSRLI